MQNDLVSKFLISPISIINMAVGVHGTEKLGYLTVEIYVIDNHIFSMYISISVVEFIARAKNDNKQIKMLNKRS
jgi:hypothetical protein